jgi:hypothetical protein
MSMKDLLESIVRKSNYNNFNLTNSPSKIIISENYDKLPLNIKEDDWHTIDKEGHVVYVKNFNFKYLKHLMYFLEEILKISKKETKLKLFIEDNIIQVKISNNFVNDITNNELIIKKFIDEIFNEIIYIDDIE